MSMPTPEQIADAIEILSMCEPISEVQGGMWFGNNHNFIDATFVDYGACRAFAVAARALPAIVARNDALVKALTDIADYSPASTIQPVAIARAALASIKVTS